jgi:hypothetical protein
MMADTVEELHEMADKIGLKRSWFQKESHVPYYDLTESKRTLALKYGAVFKAARDQARERFLAQLQGAGESECSE